MLLTIVIILAIVSIVVSAVVITHDVKLAQAIESHAEYVNSLHIAEFGA